MKSVDLLLKSPFRKDSVRDKVYRFLLLQSRTRSAFVKYVRSLGADPVDVIRFFRSNGMLDEGMAGWLSLTK